MIDWLAYTEFYGVSALFQLYNQIYPWKINPVIENRDWILMHLVVSGIMWVDHIDSIITT